MGMNTSITAAVLSLFLSTLGAARAATPQVILAPGSANGASDNVPDLNGDGRPDAVRLGAEEFLVEVFLSGLDGLPGEPSARLEVPEARLAIWNGVTGLAIVPDLTADGVDDLIVVSTMRGVNKVHVWAGGQAGLSAEPDFSFPLTPSLQSQRSALEHTIEPLDFSIVGRAGVRVSGRVFLTTAEGPVPAHASFDIEDVLAADRRVRQLLGGQSGATSLAPEALALEQGAVRAQAELHLIVLDALTHDPARARQLFAEQGPVSVLRLTHAELEYGSILAARSCVRVLDRLLADGVERPDTGRLLAKRAELTRLAAEWEAAYGAE